MGVEGLVVETGEGIIDGSITSVVDGEGMVEGDRILCVEVKEE